MIHFQLGDGCITSLLGEQATGVPCYCSGEYETDDTKLPFITFLVPAPPSEKLAPFPENQNRDKTQNLLDLDNYEAFLPLIQKSVLQRDQHASELLCELKVSIPDQAELQLLMPPIKG